MPMLVQYNAIIRAYGSASDPSALWASKKCYYIRDILRLANWPKTTITCQNFIRQSDPFLRLNGPWVYAVNTNALVTQLNTENPSDGF
jgi:hypothetical protein